MPTSSASSYSPSYQFASRLCRRLKLELDRQCARYYDAGILLRRLAIRHVEAAKDTTVLHIRVDCRGSVNMPVRVTVSRKGRTLFDVCCSVEQGGSHQFSYSCPAPVGQVETFEETYLPTLEHDLANFLRKELENLLGRLLLQGPAGPPRN